MRELQAIERRNGEVLRTFIVHALPSTSEVKVNALHSSFCVCGNKVLG
jgi:hypothetical protein